jgi:uncharacterized membrane protein HdeD (DUF308 family)
LNRARVDLLSEDPINAHRSRTSSLRRAWDALRCHWFCLDILGVSLAVLGTVALGYVAIASPAAATGVRLLVAGAAGAEGQFRCHGRSGFFLELPSGVLSIVVGLLLLRARFGALAALTLLLVRFLMVGGIRDLARRRPEFLPGDAL